MNDIKKKPSTIKKILKWFSIVVLILLIALISIPYLFKDKIKLMVENTINKSVNATVSFNDINLSLLKSFPLANLTLDKILVINKAPFLGDTLFYGKEVNLDMSIMELFKDENEAMNIQRISLYHGNVNIIINKDGIGNYDIAKETEKTAETATQSNLSLNIQEYQVTDLDFSYLDEASKMKVGIDSIIHAGQGNFEKDILDLNTKSTAKISVEMNGTNYMENVLVSLDAIIGIDLKNSKYTFKENAGFVNQLPLEFNGFIQLIEEGQLYDINFKTPTSSFKNLLALLPKQYAGNLNSIKTEGDFTVNGVVKGIYADDKIPTFDISFASNNASFKYTELPKAVKNINIDTKITNKTGFLNDTHVDVNKLNFTIDEDAFAANMNISNIEKNPKIKLTANGTINLESISQVYPVSLDTKLAGILKANVTTSLDMKSIENKKYENVKNSGTLILTSFKYEGKEVAKPFIIDKTSISFNTNTIKLNEFSAKTGESDLKINGDLENFYGFLFKDQVLKGNFNLVANKLKVSDFLADEEETSESTSTERLKIPSFLDCTFNATASTVIYDNLNLKNVSGKLVIKNEAIDLQNLKMAVFGGQIGMSGKVSTKEKISNFAFDIDLKEVGIGESFTQLNTLKVIAPIAKTIEGKLNSTLKFSGNLANDMTPDLKTISGTILGQLLNTKINADNSKALSLLSNKISFLDVSKLDLNEASMYLTFNDGNVKLKPLNLNYKDIGILVGGTHGFDQTMNYDLKLDIPAKYLGTEVTNYLSKLTPKEAESIKSIPVTANLTGNFSNPTIKTNLDQATSKLISDLIEKQKQSLLDKGKDKLNSLLNGNKPKDSSKTKEDTKNKIKGVISNLFNKKKKDSTN